MDFAQINLHCLVKLLPVRSTCTNHGFLLIVPGWLNVKVDWGFLLMLLESLSSRLWSTLDEHIDVSTEPGLVSMQYFYFSVIIWALHHSEFASQNKLNIFIARTNLILKCISVHDENFTCSLLLTVQVWKSKQLWDGFIRCCIKLRPQSYQVLLQLPPERLESVFQREPSIRAQVRRHVENFSSAQVSSFLWRSLRPTTLVLFVS